MSTYNIYFHGEVKKIFTSCPLLPRPMYFSRRNKKYINNFLLKKCPNWRMANSADTDHCAPSVAV